MVKEDGRYTPEQVRLPEFLEAPTIDSMLTGSIAYISEEAVIVDDELRCWVDGNATFRTQVDTLDTDLTLIRINEGFIIDVSGLPHKKGLFKPLSNGEVVSDTSVAALPVAGFVVNEKDLLEFDTQYREQTGQKYIPKSRRKEIKKALKKVRLVGNHAVENYP